MTKYDYDLFTIGAGSGGVRATRLAASYGARAAVVLKKIESETPKAPSAVEPELDPRLDAAVLLGRSKAPSAKTVMLERLKAENDAEVKSALSASLRKVEASLAWGDRINALLSGCGFNLRKLLRAFSYALGKWPSEIVFKLSRGFYDLTSSSAID